MQIFVPTADRDGGLFSQTHFQDLKEELATSFGGVTIYARSPVKGIWKPSGESEEKDDLIIFEILVQQLDIPYWSTLKSRLEKQFRQEEILMRYFSVSTVK